MRSAGEWLSAYGESHRNPTNERLHWICVPVIVWCLVGLLWTIPVPAPLEAHASTVNFASLAIIAALIYYARLSVPLALGCVPLLIAMLWSVEVLARHLPVPLWAVCDALFVLAWIGQFVGHAIEGKRPSFLQDVQFLLIGPLWLLAQLYRRLDLQF